MTQRTHTQQPGPRYARSFLVRMAPMLIALATPAYFAVIGLTPGANHPARGAADAAGIAVAIIFRWITLRQKDYDEMTSFTITANSLSVAIAGAVLFVVLLMAGSGSLADDAPVGPMEQEMRERLGE